MRCNQAEKCSSMHFPAKYPVSREFALTKDIRRARVCPLATPRQHLLHFVHKLPKVERAWTEPWPAAARCAIGIARHRRKPGDEHDLDVGIELGSAAREF